MKLNYQDFQKAIQELEAFYGGTVLNGGILESAWYDALSRISVEDLEYAIAQCFKFHPRQYNYFPSPEDIRKLAFDTQENHQSAKIFDANKFQLPPENNQEAHKRGLIGRLYQHYKIKNRVGRSSQDREEFSQRFSTYSVEQLETLLDTELGQMNDRFNTGIKLSDAATSEGREYLKKLSYLIRGKTL